jgi:cell division protein ZapE
MLMDMFHETAAIRPKRRVHFHAFMQDVHARLHAARRASADAIAPVARAIARDAALLCLDEMQIADIADAMIVGRLFEAMLDNGTVIVTTSNLPPTELYPDGLNRALFLPFIGLIESRLDIVSLDGPADYRLGRVKAHESFIWPLGADADAALQDMWERLTETAMGEPRDLALLGRTLHVPQAARGCVRFTFAELCEAPLGPPDYLALAEGFGTVFVERIPRLAAADPNAARRFILLIDALYDARRRLVASAEGPPEALAPSGKHRMEFGRTASRLREMQSAAWWGKKIAET